MNGRLRRFLRILGLLVALAILALLGAWVADRWLLPRSVGRGSSFAMPLLEGSSRAEVYELCSRYGLVISERPAEFDASLPSAYLLRQMPRAGTQVKPGRRVSVVFSAGPRLVSVPTLRGESERQARLWLEDLGLLPGDVLRVSGAEAAGRVLSSRPGPGLRVPLGTRVDLLLSSGPPGRDFLVPDLRRRDLDEVLALLDAHGMGEPRIRFRVDRGGGRRILDQSPPPGSRLEEGRILELVVASQSP